MMKVQSLHIGKSMIKKCTSNKVYGCRLRNVLMSKKNCMNRGKFILALCTVLIIAVIGACIMGHYSCCYLVRTETNFNVESLRWTMIGAIGSWAGSVFGAIALIIFLFALWLPQRVRIKVSVSTGCLLSQMPGENGTDA